LATPIAPLKRLIRIKTALASRRLIVTGARIAECAAVGTRPMIQATAKLTHLSTSDHCVPVGGSLEVKGSLAPAYPDVSSCSVGRGVSNYDSRVTNSYKVAFAYQDARLRQDRFANPHSPEGLSAPSSRIVMYVTVSVADASRRPPMSPHPSHRPRDLQLNRYSPATCRFGCCAA
jgi:hypothetical protein